MQLPQQEQELSRDFVQGFNEGYFIAAELPHLATDMSRYMPESERGAGFGKGVEQYTKDMHQEKVQQLEKDFKANTRDLGLDKNSPENLKKDFTANKESMGVKSKDRLTEWLNDKDENKSDMGLDRDRERLHDDREPDLD